MPEKRITTREAAEYLGVPAWTLTIGRTARDPRKRVPIPYEKDKNGYVWYKKSDLDAYAERKKRIEEAEAVKAENDGAIAELKKRIHTAEEELGKACAERGAAENAAREAQREAQEWRGKAERAVGCLALVIERIDAALKDIGGKR